MEDMEEFREETGTAPETEASPQITAMRKVRQVLRPTVRQQAATIHPLLAAVMLQEAMDLVQDTMEK